MKTDFARDRDIDYYCWLEQYLNLISNRFKYGLLL